MEDRDGCLRRGEEKRGERLATSLVMRRIASQEKPVLVG